MLIQAAKEELDNSIQEFLSSKFVAASRIAETSKVANIEHLKLAKQSLDNALMKLIRCQTIWRSPHLCLFEDHVYVCARNLLIQESANRDEEYV